MLPACAAEAKARATEFEADRNVAPGFVDRLKAAGADSLLVAARLARCGPSVTASVTATPANLLIGGQSLLERLTAAEGLLDVCRAGIETALDAIWACGQRGEMPTDDMLINARLACVTAVHQIAAIVQTACALGSTAPPPAGQVCCKGSCGMQAA